MSDTEYHEYIRNLKEQAKELAQEGWNTAAIKGYFKYVDQSVKKLSGQAVFNKIKKIETERYSVGSQAFLALLKSAYPNNRSGDKKTINLLYKVLGAKLDKNGFLQLTNMKLTTEDKKGKYYFTTNIQEAIGFDKEFSKLVKEYYGKGIPTSYDKGTPEYELAKETHQFRYFLDKKNMDAMRASFPNEKTDLDRIQAFEAKYGGLASEKARYHNKYSGKAEDYPEFIKKYGENVKFVTSPEFHSEWIVDKNGAFVSQWNSYEFDSDGNVDSNPKKKYSEEQQLQIVDGNSVNFADSSDSKDHHIEFDSTLVGKYDPQVRNDIGEKWRNPSTNSKRADYYDRDKSEKISKNILKEAKK